MLRGKCFSIAVSKGKRGEEVTEGGRGRQTAWTRAGNQWRRSVLKAEEASVGTAVAVFLSDAPILLKSAEGIWQQRHFAFRDGTESRKRRREVMEIYSRVSEGKEREDAGKRRRERGGNRPKAERCGRDTTRSC